MEQINRINFIKESEDLVEYVKKNNIKELEHNFSAYKEKYQKHINDPDSKLYSAIPFFKSIEEYIYSPLAKDHNFTSLEIIEDFFENDVKNLK